MSSHKRQEKQKNVIFKCNVQHTKVFSNIFLNNKQKENI